MGCVGAVSVPAPPDTLEDGQYDKKWDDLRERYKLSKSGRNSDGERAAEPGRCGYCMARKVAGMKGRVSLKLAGITFKPQPVECSPADFLSSRDRGKIQSWLEGLPELKAFACPGSPSQSEMSGRGSIAFAKHGSVHTVYSHDEDEELVMPDVSASGSFAQQPQRLTDKRAINRLQMQLKEKDKQKKEGAAEAKKKKEEARSPRKSVTKGASPDDGGVVDSDLLDTDAGNGAEEKPPLLDPPPAGRPPADGGLVDAAAAPSGGAAAPPPGVVNAAAAPDQAAK